jgi:hypothetical protein
MGLAAALAIAVGLLFPGSGAPPVEAAVVLTKLTEQVQGDTLIDVTLDSVVADEASVDARIQVAPRAIAGDVHVRVIDEDDGPIEIDASLAISDDGGWVLIRKLVVPLPDEAKPILDMLMPEGSELMLKLPASVVAEILEEKLHAEFDEVHGLASGQIVAVVKGILESKADVGAIVENLGDGTVRLTIPVGDAEAFQNLIRLAARAVGSAHADKIEIDVEDLDEHAGATFAVVYDPRAEAVRSFSVSNLAGIKGSVSVSLSTGSIDAPMLDPQRVTTSKTRTFDVGALKSMVEAIQKAAE